MEDEIALEEIASTVVVKMQQIPQLNLLPVAELLKIPLGRLRRDATRLHAVCRYQKGVKKSEISGPDDVRCVDVHPAGPDSRLATLCCIPALSRISPCAWICRP